MTVFIMILLNKCSLLEHKNSSVLMAYVVCGGDSALFQSILLNLFTKKIRSLTLSASSIATPVGGDKDCATILQSLNHSLKSLFNTESFTTETIIF